MFITVHNIEQHSCYFAFLLKSTDKSQMNVKLRKSKICINYILIYIIMLYFNLCFADQTHLDMKRGTFKMPNLIRVLFNSLQVLLTLY